jgi:PAS domain S-box-containing protein
MTDRQKIIKIFKASPTPTSIVLADDPEFTFLQVNDAYCKMTQRSEEELIGNSLFKSFPPNPDEEKPTGVDRLISSFRKVIETGEEDEMNKIRYDLIMEDDKYKELYFQVVNTPVFDDNGKVEFIVNSATNITEHTLNERHHEMMLNNAEDSFVLIDLDKNILSFNEAYAEKAKDIFGDSPKVGLSIMKLALPERVKKVNKILDKVFSGEIVRADLSMTNQDGKERFFHSTYRPAYNESGDIYGALFSIYEKTEEHKAKRNLEENEARYRTLIENGSDVIFVLSSEAKPTYISPSIENVLGYTQEEAYNMDLMEVVHPDDISIIQTELEKCMGKPGEPIKVTPARMMHKDSTYRWCEGTITNMLHDPAINGIVDNFRDITDRIEAEQEILESKDQYQSLVQTIDGVVWEAEPDTLNLTYISPQASSLLGHDPEEWKSIHGFWEDHIHPEDQDTILTQFNKLVKAGKNHELEYRFRTGNGNYIWVRDVITVISENDKPKIIRGVIIDINETIEAQKQVSKTEEKYRNVVEHSTNMFYHHDLTGTLTYISPQSTEFLGYTPEEVKLKWTQFLTNHPINKEGEKLTQKAIETGEVQPPYELQLHTADNRIIWVKVNEAPLIKDGEVVGIVGSLSDITDRKKYEKQLKQSLERYDYVSKVSRDAIYDWDITNNKIHWGEGFTTLFGHRSGEDKYPLKSWSKLVHSDDIGETERDLKFTLEDPSMNSWSYEYRLKKAQGGYAYVIEKGYIIRNDDGQAIRMIGALRDITESKQVELQNEINREIADYFKVQDRLKPILTKVISFLTEYGKFETAEIWLTNNDKTHQNLITSYSKNKAGETFYDHSKEVIKFKKGEGLPGTIWESKEIQVWDDIDSRKTFIRRDAAKKAGLRSAFGIPLFHNNELSGVLLLSSELGANLRREVLTLFEGLQDFLGSEIKRKQQEEEFKLLFESAPEILAIVHPDGHFVKVNQAFCNLLGYTEGELTSQPFDNFIYSEDLRETKEEFTKTITSNENSHNYINRYETKAGELVWISWYSSDVFGEDGFMFAYGRDVTETKEAGLKLEEAYKEKVDILESIDDGFFTLNKNWTVTYWNKAAERLLHTPKQDIVGQNLWDVFEDAVDLPSYTNYHRTMHEGINVDFEDYYESLNKWFSISSYPAPEGISVFFKNITEQKVARKKLEELNAQLKQRANELTASNAELEQFAYVASHDLQEPLRMVTSFLTQLEKKYKDQLDEKAASYIHYAVDGAQRMRQIILDLLNYSRLNQDKSVREECDLNKLFEDAKALEQSHIKETKAMIIIDQLPVLKVNPGAIKQVFQNLLNNALKYHTPGNSPQIHVSAKELDSHWQFSFKDNGIGINKEFQHNIFQLFQRLHTRENYSGTGIGLAIGKKIIERHGGDIWVESDEGKGSTFFFTLNKNL